MFTESSDERLMASSLVHSDACHSPWVCGSSLPFFLMDKGFSIYMFYIYLCSRICVKAHSFLVPPLELELYLELDED